MTTAIFHLEVYGDSFQNILDKTRHSLAEFFEVDVEEVDRKIKYEIEISDQSSSFLGEDYEEEPYTANVTAKVRIDEWR
jgi:hypothetical protein